MSFQEPIFAYMIIGIIFLFITLSILVIKVILPKYVYKQGHNKRHKKHHSRGKE